MIHTHKNTFTIHIFIHVHTCTYIYLHMHVHTHRQTDIHVYKCKLTMQTYCKSIPQINREEFCYSVQFFFILSSITMIQLLIFCITKMIIYTHQVEIKQRETKLSKQDLQRELTFSGALECRDYFPFTKSGSNAYRDHRHVAVIQ